MLVKSTTESHQNGQMDDGHEIKLTLYRYITKVQKFT